MYHANFVYYSLDEILSYNFLFVKPFFYPASLRPNRPRHTCKEVNKAVGIQKDFITIHCGFPFEKPARLFPILTYRYTLDDSVETSSF